MTSLYNPTFKCFVVSKHRIFITYPTNYDTIILHFIVEVDRIRIKRVDFPKKITGCAVFFLIILNLFSVEVFVNLVYNES